MKLQDIDFAPHTDTLVAVFLGALLATLSGVIANQFEAFFKRRERERAAALLFGEVLSTLKLLLEGAERTRGVGDPRGPVTKRMLLAARREMDIYERNRESLTELRDAGLRVDLHGIMVRLSIALDGLLSAMDAPDEAERWDRAFDFLMINADRLTALIARLGVLARHPFEEYAELARAAPMPGDAATRRETGDG